MGLTDILFGRQIQASVDTAVAQELERHGVAESSLTEDDYAFRLLSGAHGRFDLPEVWTQRILNQSHHLYDSHGLAEVIIDRILSIILEGGLAYEVQFDETVQPDEDYELYKRAASRRLEKWWYAAETNIQERARMFITELLLSGEHGWRIKVAEGNGWVRIGDFTRLEVKDLIVDDFDRMQLAAVALLSTGAEDGAVLHVIGEDQDPASPSYTFLTGDCIYHRFKPRASKRRGKPVLQTVIDELTAEKKFRVLGVDRMIARLSVFLQTVLEGKSDKEVEDYAKKVTHKMPAAGTRIFVNEKIKNDFVAAKLEAYEISNTINTMISVIAGMLGFPPSWLGIGEGSNRAIAETQQEPAERNTKSEKENILGAFERVLYFVVDQAIIAKYVTQDPRRKVNVKDSDGNVISKSLRECITINVYPVPLAAKKKDEKPLSASTAAAELMVLLNELARNNSGKSILDSAQRAALLNAGFKEDGVGIEIFGDAFVDAAEDLGA